MTSVRWEYKTFGFDATGFLTGKLDTAELERILNDLGREGWELVNATPHLSRMGRGRGLVVLLKRQR